MQRKDDRNESASAPDLADAYSEISPRIRRMGARQAVDGDDVLQDACVRVLRQDGAGRVGDPVSYLFRVARNLLIDRQRSLKRERNLFDLSTDPESAFSDRFDPERILDGKERLDIALEAIGALPPRCREAFVMNRFEGQNYAMIARTMGISTSMVEKHIAEAMLRLVRAVNGRGMR
jgi:RNA polymerase sigma-70 factor (ECF subfamily)